MPISVEPVLAAAAALGESPVWDERTQTLLWVDIHRHEVHRFDPASGSDHSFRLDEPVGSVALRADGGLLGAVGLSIGAIDEATGSFTPWHTVHEGDRMNDGACDPAGRYLAGTLTEPLADGASALFSVDADGSIRTVLQGVTLSNGLAWSADGRTLYYVDTVLERIDAFAYDVATGTVDEQSRRVAVDLHDVDGRPDGLTIDTEGNLWVAMARGRAVRCYDASGQLLHHVEVPAPVVTSCTFGGPDRTDLYVTTGQWPLSGDELDALPHAGAVFRLRGTGATGARCHHFGTAEHQDPA